jgi:phage baseplate assembly protein W
MADVTYYFDVSKKSINPLNNGDIAILKNMQAILESISNIIQTGRNTVLMKPEQGIDLDQYIFEPIDDLTALQIKDDIEHGLNKYEPRIKNVVVMVIPDEENQTFNIIINCIETITNSNQQFEINFNKIR